MNPRNILIVIGVVVALLIGLVVIGNVLNALIPLVVTAVIAFILGRLSVNFKLLDFIRSARAQSAKPAEQKPAAMKTAETLLEKPVAQAKPSVAPPKAEAPTAEPQVKNRELLDPDFEVKTPEQIEAEARQREQEITKGAASGGDVNAALEERRKRLLGGKGE